MISLKQVQFKLIAGKEQQQTVYIEDYLDPVDFLDRGAELTRPLPGHEIVFDSTGQRTFDNDGYQLWAIDQHHISSDVWKIIQIWVKEVNHD